jgi:uncharacterized surface protein with fasciclin (FAS1) repeats
VKKLENLESLIKYNMKNNLIIMLLLLVASSGCVKKYSTFYDPPKNLGSDLYTTLATDKSGDFTTFVKAIDLAPTLKAEISSSGLYTIFAPTNQAFESYFATNADGYRELKDIPVEKLELMLRYHVLKWMLFAKNFATPLIASNYQYETRAAVSIKDMTASANGKQLFYDNKWIQVYNQRFFPNNFLKVSDYSDVYGSGSTFSQYFNVMGASPSKVDLRSANGVIHTINVLLELPPTIAQYLEQNKDNDGGYYNTLRSKLLYYYYDDSQTRKQINGGDVNNDGLIDSLYRRRFFSEPGLSLNLLDQEYITKNVITSISQSAVTVFTPDAASFSNYYTNQILPSFYNKTDSIPFLTWWLLFKSQCSYGLNWPSLAYSSGASNDIGEKISVSSTDVKSIKMLSNGLYYQLNKMVEPKLFQGVLGPAFFDNKFTFQGWIINQATYNTYLLNSTTNNFTFFGLSNKTLGENPQLDLQYQEYSISNDGTVLTYPLLYKPVTTPAGLITKYTFPTATYLSMLQSQTLKGSYAYSQLQTADDFYETYAGWYYERGYLLQKQYCKRSFIRTIYRL